MSGKDALIRLLRESPAEELTIIDKGKDYVVQDAVISCLATDPVGVALSMLSDNKIHALPVFDTKEKKYIGFFDTLDLVRFVLAKLSNIPQPTEADIQAIAAEAAACQVGELVDLSTMDPFVLVKKGTPMLQVAEMFAKGIHRAALYDSDDDPVRLTGILSQSAFVRWIVPKLNSLGPAVEKTMVELGNLGMGDVLSVNEHDSTLLALKRIGLYRVSAAAVLNKEGKIVESFSAYDLHGLMYEPVGTLLKPVTEFLRPLRRRHMPVHITGPVALSPTNTLAEVLTLLEACAVHRVWLVDDDGRVQGVVSITDAVDALLHRM